MAYSITTKDGITIDNIPDDVAPDSQILKNRVAKIRGSGVASAAPSTFQQVQASVPGRVLQGMRDPIDEAAALLPKGLQAITSLGGYAPNPVSKFFGSEAQRVQDINRANEAQYQAARQATGETGMDVSRFAGNVVSPVNAAVAARVPGALRGAQAIKSGIVSGAIGGALTSSGDVQSPDYWKNKLQSTALGAGTGGLVSGATTTAARMIRPETNEKVVELLRQGVTPTPGQIIGGTAQKVEEQLQSVPILGHAITAAKEKSLEEFNKAAMNRALKPIGEKVSQAGREGVQEVESKIGSFYDKILPKISFKPDAQFNAEFSNLRQMATGLGEKEQAKFNSIINDVMSKASPNGSMTGETFKIVESKLLTEAKKFSGSTDAYQKELGDALNEALRVMREALPRANPQFAKELTQANTAWANYARIRGAASSTAAGAREGIFTPAQLASAVRAADKTAGKGASAKGTALMQDLAEQGTNVLGSKVPDSGTAGRALTSLGLGTAAGATGTAIPAGIGLTAASLPYLPGGRQLAATVLTKRPESAKQLAELIRRTIPYGAGGIPLGFDLGQ